MIGTDLRVRIKPYSYEMRTMMIQKQLEEQRVLTAVEQDQTITDDMQRADILARSIDKLASMTFTLVANSISAIEILGQEAALVTDKDHISEWLTNIDKNTADAVISAVNALVFHMKGGLDYDDAFLLTTDQRQSMAKMIQKHYDDQNPNKKPQL